MFLIAFRSVSEELRLESSEEKIASISAARRGICREDKNRWSSPVFILFSRGETWCHRRHVTLRFYFSRGRMPPRQPSFPMSSWRASHGFSLSYIPCDLQMISSELSRSSIILKYQLFPFFFLRAGKQVPRDPRVSSASSITDGIFFRVTQLTT